MDPTKTPTKSFTEEEAPTKGEVMTTLVEVDNGMGAPVPQGLTLPAGAEGAYDSEDIQTPRLSLVAKTGKMADEFTPGNFVVNKEVDIGKEVHGVVALQFRKYWMEKIEFEEGVFPKRFYSKAEYEAEGYKEQWDADLRVVRAMDAVLLVPVPPEIATSEFEGQGYTTVLYSAAASSYKTFGMTLITASVRHLRTGIHHGDWTLKSELKSGNANTWFVSKILSGGRFDGPSENQDERKAKQLWIEQEILPTV